MATPIGQIPLRKKGQTSCTEHKGKHLDLYCEKCDTLICLKCLSTSHKGHDICELSELTPTKKQDIKNFIDKTKQNDLVQLQKYITSTDTLLKDNTSNFENLSHELKHQTEKLKQDLDLLTAKTLSLYHKMEEDNVKLIQTYKKDLEIYDNQLKQQIKEYKTSLQHGSHIEIHDTRCEMYSEISLPMKPVLCRANFKPNQNHEHHLEMALGEIAMLDQDQASNDQDRSVGTSGGQKPSSTSQQSEPKGKEAVTQDGSVRASDGQKPSSTSQQSEPKGKEAVAQDGSVRASDGQKPSSTSQQSEPKGKEAVTQDGSDRASDGQKPSSTSQQSEPKGKEAATLYNLLPQSKVLEEWRSPVYIESICPTTDGQVWTNHEFSDTLNLLDRKGNLTQQVKRKTSINHISLSPTTHTLWVCDGENDIMELVSGQLTHRFSTKEIPRCICVTASNHVIVGMTKNISKFTTQGEMVLTKRTTGTGKPLVCSPRRISECPVTNNVALVDTDGGGDWIPHVVVMDTDFRELFVYRGDIPTTSHKGAKAFDPWDVAYDSVGNIIIGDFDNNRVLLISGGGEFLRVIHTDTDCTFALGVDREDVLWAVFGGLSRRNAKLLQYSNV